MNERIEELYHQSWYKTESLDYNKDLAIDDSMGYSFDAKKFAELIVRECAALAKSKSEHIQSMLTDDRGDQAQIHSLAWQFEEFGYKIKQHFGVEE